MTSGPRTRLVARRARWRLLVLAVVAGVLAMHALSPSGTPSAGEHVMVTGPAGAGHHAETAGAQGGVGRHLSDAGQDMVSDAGRGRVVSEAGQDRMVSDAGRDRMVSDAGQGRRAFRPGQSRMASGAGSCGMVSGAGQGGMVMDHAGGTCAAAGTAASYVPPALPPAPTAPTDPASVAQGAHLARAVGGRAPPDLSQLQLLRI
ncbi:DUF6153 family protein [Streptomyces sp. NPDC093261]|uniref:DUF6153 family protein n=1 Tax=Streptomyces sp. NPDC093261 TaxID=3366037 RepID=UPI0038223A2E